jgi:hypothetical protein
MGAKSLVEVVALAGCEGDRACHVSAPAGWSSLGTCIQVSRGSGDRRRGRCGDGAYPFAELQPLAKMAVGKTGRRRIGLGRLTRRPVQLYEETKQAHRRAALVAFATCE